MSVVGAGVSLCLSKGKNSTRTQHLEILHRKLPDQREFPGMGRIAKEEAVVEELGTALEGCSPFKSKSESWPFKSVSVSPDVSGRVGCPAVYRRAEQLTFPSSERRGAPSARP
jgi:hypothetical protein